MELPLFLGVMQIYLFICIYYKCLMVQGFVLQRVIRKYKCHLHEICLFFCFLYYLMVIQQRTRYHPLISEVSTIKSA